MSGMNDVIVLIYLTLTDLINPVDIEIRLWIMH